MPIYKSSRPHQSDLILEHAKIPTSETTSYLTKYDSEGI